MRNVPSFGRIRKLPKSPFGYLPVVVSLSGSSRCSLFLVQDGEGLPSLPQRLVEVTNTITQAQALLEFYLSKHYAEAEAATVVTLTVCDILDCLARIQVALPLAMALAVREVLSQIGVVPRIRFHKEGCWKDTALGETNFQLMGLPGPENRQKVQELAAYLKKQAGYQHIRVS